MDSVDGGGPDVGPSHCRAAGDTICGICMRRRPPAGHLPEMGPCQVPSGQTTYQNGTRYGGPRQSSSANRYAKPCSRTPPTADLLGTHHVRKPQSARAHHKVIRKGLPLDFADMFCKLAKLQGINPGRGPNGWHLRRYLGLLGVLNWHVRPRRFGYPFGAAVWC